MKLDNRKTPIGIVAFTTELLRIGLKLLFAIFFPAYTLLPALSPKRDDLGGVERLALTFGLSHE